MGSCTSKQAIDFFELINKGVNNKEEYLLNLLLLLRNKKKLPKHEQRMIKQLIDEEIKKNVNDNIDEEITQPMD